jgi:hypothetical protein
MSVLLTAGASQQAITDDSNTNTGRVLNSLPPGVRQELQKEKAAMQTIYLEFTETNRGTLTNWNYGVASVYSAYFAGSHFYRREQQSPGYEYYNNEVAFDGQTIWRQYESFSVYFNLDGGTGKIRGIFESGNTAPSQIFDAWMGPFKEMGMKTVSPWDIGGGDDNSFRRAGLPSFGFAQDPIEYESRTHHSNADVYERIQPDDMQFNTAVLASFAWQAAQRDEKFPR